MNDETISQRRARVARVRAGRSRLELQERDHEILRHVWESRFLTRSLLTWLFPPASGLRDTDHIALARRLQGLWARGYLDRFRAPDSRQFAYGLGPRGAKVLLARGHAIKQTDWEEKNRRVAELFVEHALMVARFRVSVILGATVTRSVRLDSFEREKQALRAVWKRSGKPVSLSPDAFCIVRDASLPDGKQRFPYLIEADRSTMPLDRLAAKYQRYVWLYEHGAAEVVYRVPTFSVLTICKSAARASNVLDLLSADTSPVPEDHRRFFLVTSDESYRDHPTNVLARVWRAADIPEELRAIIPSPLPRAS